MTLRQSTILIIGLLMIAALVACGGSSHKNTVPSIAATSGGSQSATVGTAFANPLVATVTLNGSPSSGASVIFTAPSAGASCSFANSTNTETDTTDANGVATSSVCTANTTSGSFNVTASTSGVGTAASFSLSNTAGAAASIAVSSGNNQSVGAGGTFGGVVAQVTDADSNPVSGVAVTFTANTGGTGATATFTSTSSNSEIANTDANGNATVSDLVANSTTGAFTVSADFAGDTGSPASFTLTNTTAVSTLADGTYVFSLAGQDIFTGYLYNTAGAFTVSGGTITGGEQDSVDYSIFTANDSITSGSVTGPDTTGNLTITLNTADPNVGNNGVETLTAVMSTSGTAGLVSEFDGFASGIGEIRLQSLPSGSGVQGYAFWLNGGDGFGFASGFGGVVNVDGPGTISGAGSVFDLDDGGGLTQGAPIDSGSTVSAPDAFGRILISLNLSTSGVGGIGLVGYIVDSNQTFLVENSNDINDFFFGVTGGVAYAQGGNTGGFSAASIEGLSFVFGTNGQNPNNYLQIAGVVTTNLDGTSVTGTLNGNDLTGIFPQAPVPFTGTYTVDSTGRVTLSNLNSNDGTTFTGITLQLYMSGGSNVAANAMDGLDQWTGPAKVQTGGGSFTAGSLSGNYGLVTTGFGSPGNFGGPETDSSGFFTADGVSAFNAGTVNQTILNSSTNQRVLTGSFSADPSGIFTGTLTGLDVATPAGTDNFSYYLIDSTSGVAIQTDTNQLTLGFFNLE